VKSFDCVELKDTVQAALRKERAHMTEQDMRAAALRELEAGKDPLARLWRALAAQKKT
jgi:hypothetical protein